MLLVRRKLSILSGSQSIQYVGRGMKYLHQLCKKKSQKINKDPTEHPRKNTVLPIQLGQFIESGLAAQEVEPEPNAQPLSLSPAQLNWILVCCLIQDTLA